jgi:hypothetical protein
MAARPNQAEDLGMRLAAAMQHRASACHRAFAPMVCPVNDGR